MPAIDLATNLKNLEGWIPKPTTMLAVQNRLHELEEPITAMALAKDLGIHRDLVGAALRRLVIKGLVRRWHIYNHRSPVHWRGKPNPNQRRPIALRRKGPVWVYEILQER